MRDTRTCTCARWDVLAEEGSVSNVRTVWSRRYGRCMLIPACTWNVPQNISSVYLSVITSLLIFLLLFEAFIKYMCLSVYIEFTQLQKKTLQLFLL